MKAPYTLSAVEYNSRQSYRYNWSLMLLMITRLGISCTELACRIGISSSGMNKLMSGVTKEPYMSTGMAILNIAGQVLTDEQVKRCIK